VTIRAIIKTSHLVQLVLLLVLGGVVGWLVQELWRVNSFMALLPRTDFLIDEIERNAVVKYQYALEYAADIEKNSKNLQRLQDIWQMEDGEKVRPFNALFHGGEKVTLRQLLTDIPLSKDAMTLVQQCLEKNEQLNLELKRAVMLAGGLVKAEDGSFVTSDTPQKEMASLLLATPPLIDLPTEVNRLHQALRVYLMNEFSSRLLHIKTTLVWCLAVASCCLLLLLGSLLSAGWLFHKRISRPLVLVRDYAETVAKGEAPPSLNMKYGDELAGMYGSLLKMQHTLGLRIRELKASERASQASSQQAMLAKAQALSSLNIAQKALATQESFLRRISQEVRKPVDDILGMSWQCLQTDLDKRQRDFLTRINQSGGNLLDSFNRILDISAAGDADFRQDSESFELPSMLELMRQSIAVSAAGKGLSFLIQADADLPTQLSGGKRHLEEILRILLNNAVQHTEKGGVRLQVSRLPLRQGDSEGHARIRFAVMDSGAGISPEEQVHLFSSQHLSAGDNTSNLGLGIQLVRHLVHFLGGELTLESSDLGSTFSFEILCSILVDAAQAGVKPVVLVADDSEINLEIASEVLKQAGFEVMRAADGQQAVESVQGRKPDLVLMDIQMPVMDGFMAARRLRELGYKPEDLPILAMTGQDDAKSRTDSQEAGMNDLLVKPLDVAALMAALAHWLPSDRADASAAASEPVPAAVKSTPSAKVELIDSGRGLAAVGGNRKLYRELLQRFVDSYGNSALLLREALQNNDLAQASRLAHTVKGVAANLGLSRITELAKKMESHLPDTPLAAEDMDNFDMAMSQTIAQIRERWGDTGHSVGSSGRLLAQEHQEGLLRLLDDLPKRMEQDWGAVENSLEAFMPLVEGTALAEHVDALLAAVNSFDTAEAREQTALLQRKLNRDGHESRLLH